jgi:hypothetical protein
MSILGRLPSILVECGVTAKQLDKALAEDVGVREAVIKKTREVREYWRSIAPSSNAKPHELYKGSGEMVDSPGEYKRSIKQKFTKDKEGKLEGLGWNFRAPKNRSDGR